MSTSQEFVDDDALDAAKAYFLAYDGWYRALRDHGMFSQLEGEAWEKVLRAEKRYHKMAQRLQPK